MESQLTCPLCSKEYRDDNLPRLLLMTGLTYCQKCIRGLIKIHQIKQEGTKNIQLTCPEDGTVIQLLNEDINAFPKNIALIKIIQTKKASLQFRDEDSSINVSKIAKQDQVQEDDEASDLITAMKQGNQSDKSPNKSKISNQPECCLLHQKPLQIVCMLDLMRICANCAIFGEHKGHQFRSLEEIQKQRSRYYESILKTMEQSQNINNRLSNKETQVEIMSVLDKKKSKIKKQIQQHYAKLKKQIQLSQKKSLNSLDQLIHKTQIRFQTLMKIDTKTINKYQKWFQQSFQQINILQGDAFEEKLQLLFFKNKKQNNDIISEGTQIINEMLTQEQNILPQIESVLQSIGIINSNLVYKCLQQFVQLQQQVKKNTSVTGLSRQQDESGKLRNQNEYQQQKIISSPMEQSLLDLDEDLSQINVVKPQFTKTQDQNFLAKVEEALNSDKNDLKINERQRFNVKNQEKKISINNGHKTTSNQPLTQRPNKKKLTKLKLSQKYDKIVKSIISDSIQNIDFTNAQLGDVNLILICEFIKGSKGRILKLIRNKLTDDGVRKIIPFLGNISTLNLSQNNLTEHILDAFLQNIGCLPSLKCLILSQNKIDQRKHKIRIDKLRKLQITVSV